MSGKATHTGVAHRCLLSQQGTVLCLTTGSPQKEDEFTSDRYSHLMAQVLFYKRECQINPGADSGRSIEFAIFDKNWISLDFQILVTLDQIIEISPMRRYPSAVD